MEAASATQALRDRGAPHRRIRVVEARGEKRGLPRVRVHAHDLERHGLARALLTVDANLRPILKSEGLLTRDPRMRERKKYGQPGARQRFQYSQR